MIIPTGKQAFVTWLRRNRGEMISSGLRLSEPMGLGLYVHLPFCRVKCTYCAFAVSTDLRLEDQYGDAILSEIGARLPLESEVDTIYWGGGTPSRTAPDWLRRIDAALRARIVLD